MENGSRSTTTISVYISFRGDEVDDVCEFSDRLCAAFESAGLATFGNGNKLDPRSIYLPNRILRALYGSWVSVVVFSRSYAASILCLQDLYQIAISVESCIVIPIFYFVDPVKVVEGFDTIWNIARRFRNFPELTVEDMLKIYYDDPTEKQSFIQPTLEDLVRVKYLSKFIGQFQFWKDAIQKVVDLRGWHLRDGPSSRVINEVIGEVLTQLRQRNYPFELVGMQSRVAKVKKLLNLGSDDDVQVVGICGMGGIGKSTLAQVLYRSISRYFDAFCFLENISELLKHDDLSLQEILLQNLETKDPDIRYLLKGMFSINTRLRHHKFLIVLDGVDLVQNLEALNLIVKSNCFGGGSRIIITTRDEQVLQFCEVSDVFKPELLSMDEAFQLFCRKAFDHNYPTRGYEEMTYSVLEYANGLPLAIVTLGSSLCQRSVQEWRSALAQLKRIPHHQIMEVLKKSFDELHHIDKEIFLDIACFFNGEEINCVKEILQSCGFPAEIGIKLLMEKSLMAVSNQRIKMHNMLQEMGRYIVRKELPYEPSEWSRLWLLDDIDYVMQKNESMAIEKVEAIVLNFEGFGGITLRIEALSHMNNLRLLIFHNVNFSGILNCLSNKLRYISWHQYPYTSLPSSFEPHALVELIMPDSNVKEIWEGKKMLPKLEKLSLSGSKNLIKMTDFGGVPNLESLDLQGCTGLLQLHPSIAEISKLKFLNLRNCINLISIPNSLFSVSSLNILNLACCSKLAHCLKFSPFEELDQSEATQQSFSSQIQKLCKQKSI